MLRNYFKTTFKSLYEYFSLGLNISKKRIMTWGNAEMHREKELKTIVSHTVFSKFSGGEFPPAPRYCPNPPNQNPGSAPVPKDNIIRYTFRKTYCSVPCTERGADRCWVSWPAPSSHWSAQQWVVDEPSNTAAAASGSALGSEHPQASLATCTSSLLVPIRTPGKQK